MLILNSRVRSENFVTHEEYSVERRSVKNDIALIKLPRPAGLNKLTQPACWKNPTNINDKLMVVGWGKTNSSQTSSDFKTSGFYSNDQYKLEVT